MLVDTSTSPYRWTVPAGSLGDPLVEGTVAAPGWRVVRVRRWAGGRGGRSRCGDPGGARRDRSGAPSTGAGGWPSEPSAWAALVNARAAAGLVVASAVGQPYDGARAAAAWAGGVGGGTPGCGRPGAPGCDPCRGRRGVDWRRGTAGGGRGVLVGGRHAGRAETVRRSTRTARRSVRRSGAGCRAATGSRTGRKNGEG